MVITSVEFIKSAVKPGQYPALDLPEVAFAGRSNVGKSSLLNVLVNRKRLARTSTTPGRTQLINFFLVNEALVLVDIPGYGYAKVPDSVRRQWKPMVEAYLSTRKNLAAVVLILDARRLPSAGDVTLAQWLQHYHIPIIRVLTKCDKLSRGRQREGQRRIAAALSLAEADLIPFSAKTRLGRTRLWRALAEQAGLAAGSEQPLEPQL
jgi:GTP-binding protein